MPRAVEADLIAGVRAIARLVHEFGQDQLPFATAVALTRLGKAWVEEQRARLPQVFEIRTKRAASGVRLFEPARKQDWPTPEAVVGVMDEFLARHEEGGVQKPKGRAIAIPTLALAEARTGSGAIAKVRKPRPLISSGKARTADESIRRKGKRKVAGLSPEQSLLYLLRPSVRLKPVLGAQALAAKVVGGQFEQTLAREFLAAVRSKRVRAGSFTPEQGRLFYLRALARTMGS